MATASEIPGTVRQRRLLLHLFRFAHLDVWARLLWTNRFAVDRQYLPRLAYILGTSAWTTLLTLPERLFFAVWRSRHPVPPPVFIVGYFRSGTTLLHNLLVRDPTLAFPTAAQAFSPHGFLAAAVYRQPIGWLLRRYPLLRPMDNMPVDLDGPEEEEFALAALGAPSAYWKFCFPRHAAYYDRFVTFDQATPRERTLWAQGLQRFLSKLTLFHGGRRPVLKSPYNTARVRYLLQLFPDAQFIHIHRHPFDVVRSHAHTVRTLVALLTLQAPPHDQDMEVAVAAEYAEVEAAFHKDLALLKPGQLAEVAFEDLEQDPVGEIRRIARALGLEFHPEFERRLIAYVRSLAGYRKNQLLPLPLDTHRRIAPILRPLVLRWGYVEPEPIDITE